jgi:putative transposase
MLFHVLNRGVEKKPVVREDADRVRFVHDLFVFNNKGSVDPNHRLKENPFSKKDRDPLVHIHAWCLMDNHYHLLLSPIDDDVINISLFMKKLNMGYAKYFNERYDRSGYLWQGKYKKIEIKRDTHFLYVPFYIHLNPLDYTHPQWRSGSVQNIEKMFEDLFAYRWSSFLDYAGMKNFPSILENQLLGEVLGSLPQQKLQISQIVTDEKISTFSNALE